MKLRIARTSLILLQVLALISAPLLPGYFYRIQSRHIPPLGHRSVPNKEALDFCPVAVFVHRGNETVALIGMQYDKKLEYYEKQRWHASYLPAKLPQPNKGMPGYSMNGVAVGGYTYLGRKNGQAYFKVWSRVPNLRVFTCWYTADDRSVHELYFKEHPDVPVLLARFDARVRALLWSFGIWSVELVFLLMLPRAMRAKARRREIEQGTFQFLCLTPEGRQK